MKSLTKDILISAFAGMVLPGLLLYELADLWNGGPIPSFEQPVQETWSSVPLPVLVHRTGDTVVQEDMDDYLVGVLLAEMPWDFEEEALKAQAVVARTYAWKAYITGGKHEDGSVCTAPSCCQGYRDREAYLQQGGTEAAVQKIEKAVQSTSGQVLCYDGELIEATYFSCSGGRTEEAAAVWGKDYAYLQAVDSPGEEAAAAYTDTASFSRTELEDKLDIALEGTADAWMGPVTYTEGNGVDTIVLGGKYFTGLEIRQKLALRSTAFSVSGDGELLTFITRGYGHRVGMSQYGADAMAVAGSTYEEILSHYYQGTELTTLEEESLFRY